MPPRYLRNLRCVRFLFLLAIVLLVITLTKTFYSLQEPVREDSCLRAIVKYGQYYDISHDPPQTVIPKRLHQIFKNVQVPTPYHVHIKTWRTVNPDWQYYFWTDQSAKKMIEDKYPQYLDLFESYTHRLQRSDAMRYFILHQYGGVYSDLDVEALKPMETYLSTNTCVVVPEPTVQTNLIFNLDTALTNCIMAGTAGHPFLEHVLQSLPGAYRVVKHNWDVLHSTGPFFLNKTFADYQSKFPLCRREDSPCHVYVAEHKYLVPSIDVPDLKTNCEWICINPERGHLQRKACEKLLGSNFANEIPPEAVTNHHWLHLGWNPRKLGWTDNICHLVPDAIMYDMIREVRPNIGDGDLNH